MNRRFTTNDNPYQLAIDALVDRVNEVGFSKLPKPARANIIREVKVLKKEARYHTFQMERAANDGRR